MSRDVFLFFVFVFFFLVTACNCNEWDLGIAERMGGGTS